MITSNINPQAAHLQPGDFHQEYDYLEHQLVQAFLLLLEMHFRERHSPSFYALSLGQSIPRLNSITRFYFGKTVFQLQDERTMQEAMYLLECTAMSSKEISYALGICDPSYFIKWFKNTAKVSPRNFRIRKLQNEKK